MTQTTLFNTESANKHGKKDIPLIGKVREMKADAINRPDSAEIEALMAAELKRRDQLIRFKQQLDVDWEDLPESIKANYHERIAKMNDWLIEWEQIRRTLLRYKAEPWEWHCKRCHTLILVPWSDNLSCRHCTQDDRWRTSFDEMAEKGWFVRRSKLLNADVIILRDDSVEVPAEYAKLTSFTLAEWREISDADPETIKQIADVKDIFGREAKVVE